MKRIMIVDRMPHPRMNGVARYMLGITSHPAPESLGIDLRVLSWGRKLPTRAWRERFSPPTGSSSWAQRLNRRILLPAAQRVSRADLIHYPYHNGLPASWAAGSIPRVVTVHGASPFSSEQWGRTSARGERLRQQLQAGAHNLAHVVTVSEWSKQELVQYLSLRPEQVAVIPNGVDLELFRPLPDPAETTAWLRATHGIQRPYLLHVGVCAPRKNMVRLVQAFGRLKQQRGIPHQLVLAGAPSDASAAVSQEVARLGLADDVIVTGPVSDQALVCLNNGADVFVFPSLYEGFGIPVLEAMACGTPVVAANCTALPEVAGDAAALVDDPTSVDDLAAVIETVLSDTAYRERLRQRGLARVQQYTWHACAEAHLRLYREIVEGL